MNLEKINKQLQGRSPEEIISWAISIAQKPIVTTNFRPYEVAILNLVTSIKKDIVVVWCDTGYNTPQTYKHAEEIIEKLDLNIHLYVPKQTVAHRNIILGIPTVEDSKHTVFTEQVKLEPFFRAMEEQQPDVWFTNLRKGQTAFRDRINIVSKSKDGILKVSPFYNWSDKDLEGYLLERGLPNEFTYFDPTKLESNRECGLHI
ncbi:possible 3'-phosphoadenosine 5'-phosphosulfate sulfotransferase [Polaribacter irgensii 23-P]|uniref:Possible 3'-phosphoadenosine 5'-phosphosulfate sulfotransferase n=1 Tax=Polaribacter irgensii 23-P TaxID=313594 RepID=A4BWA2_9FLAO|nr:phosphoadenosine phosphosulfate reductase family protein [Polaribacter irgensii]EAR13243.1 possible 3'-phosphoadenosine 5'-phosphosulfate sulfotransferase [Polaribacter irgensii 23-P]